MTVYVIAQLWYPDVSGSGIDNVATDGLAAAICIITLCLETHGSSVAAITHGQGI